MYYLVVRYLLQAIGRKLESNKRTIVLRSLVFYKGAFIFLTDCALIKDAHDLSTLIG